MKLSFESIGRESEIMSLNRRIGETRNYLMNLENQLARLRAEEKVEREESELRAGELPAHLLELKGLMWKCYAELLISRKVSGKQKEIIKNHMKLNGRMQDEVKRYLMEPVGEGKEA